MVGVPEELGGAVERALGGDRGADGRGARPRRHGHRGRLPRPGRGLDRARLWGDADQQATYLPAFVGDDVPAAALAVLEPRPLFDPFELHDHARAAPAAASCSSGAKSLVPRAADAELFVVAAELEDRGPALFLVESASAGLSASSPSPAMGLRAAATGTADPRATSSSPPTALLGDADRDGLRRVRRARRASAGARSRSAPARPCSTT